MIQILNLNQVPNQTLSVNLADDSGNVMAVDISLRTLSDNYLYMGLMLNGDVQFRSRRCIDGQPLMLNNKLGGNLMFVDLFGNQDPFYTDFNDRYVLAYIPGYTI